MFVKTFKKNYPLQLVLLAIIPLLLWIPAFISSPDVVSTSFDMPIYKLIYSIFSPLKLLSTILAFALVLLQGLLINNIFSYNQLCPKTTFLPAFIYILLLSSNYSSMTISPILISNTFILFAILFLFRSYDKRDGVDEIYNTNLFVSLAALTFLPSVLLIIWVWFSLLNYKQYKWRYWIISVLGLLTPLIFLIIYYFLKDQLILRLNSFLESFSHLPNIYFYLKPIHVVFYIAMALFGLITLYNTLANKSENNISFRKKTNVIAIYSLMALLPTAYCLEQEELIFFFAPAFALQFYNFFFAKRKLLYSNLIFSLFLLLVISRVLLTIR